MDRPNIEKMKEAGQKDIKSALHDPNVYSEAVAVLDYVLDLEAQLITERNGRLASDLEWLKCGSEMKKQLEAYKALLEAAREKYPEALRKCDYLYGPSDLKIIAIIEKLEEKANEG